MYIYFNEQGILTTQILHGESPVRQGSSFDIYVLFETTERIEDKVLSIQFKRPGEQTFGTEYFLSNNYLGEIEFNKLNDKEITYDLIDGKKYKTYKFTVDVNTYVTAKFGNTEALITVYQETDLEQEPSEEYQTIREIKTKGLVNIYIEKTFGKAAIPTITDEQYNYLISYVGTLLNAFNNVRKTQNLVNVYSTESDLTNINVANFEQGYKVQILTDSLHDNMSTVYQLNSDKEWEYYGTYNEILVEEIAKKLDKTGGKIDGNLEINGLLNVQKSVVIPNDKGVINSNTGEGLLFMPDGSMALNGITKGLALTLIKDLNGLLCREYTFPDKDGEIVLKEDLNKLVDIESEQTILGQKTFSKSIITPKVKTVNGISNNNDTYHFAFAPTGIPYIKSDGLNLYLLNEEGTLIKKYAFPDKDGNVVLSEDLDAKLLGYTTVDNVSNLVGISDKDLDDIINEVYGGN